MSPFPTFLSPATTRWKHPKRISSSPSSHLQLAQVWRWHHLIRRWTVFKESISVRCVAVSEGERGHIQNQTTLWKYTRFRFSEEAGRVSVKFLAFFLLTSEELYSMPSRNSEKDISPPLLLPEMSAVSQQPNITFHNIFRKSCGPTVAQMWSSASFSSRLRRSGEGRSRHSVIADSSNPLPHLLLRPDELRQRGHLQLQAFLPSRARSQILCAWEEGSRVSVI